MRRTPPRFSWKEWLICVFWRGHDWQITHQRKVTDYYSCLHCGRSVVRFDRVWM